MKKNASLAIVLTLSLLLSGCWDQRNIQDIYYITAIGIDYDNGTYICYGQLLDFSSVSKLETGKPDKAFPTNNGIGKGKTLHLAMNNLIRSSQQMVSWSHLSGIVLSKRMLEHGIDPITDKIARFHEVRYTPWMYGTEEDLITLFIQKPLFNLSTVSTILHEPIDNYRQQSFIPPIRMNEMFRQYHEPAHSVLLPKLVITRSAWQSDQSKHSMLYSNGAFLIQNKQYVGELSHKDLLGYRWVTHQTVASSLTLEQKGTNGPSSISIRRVTPKLSWTLVQQVPKFEIQILAMGKIEELNDDGVSNSDLSKSSSEKIKEEVRITFEKALAKGFDIYGLQESVRRKNPLLWRELIAKQRVKLDDQSLANIRVHVILDSSGQLGYEPA